MTDNTLSTETSGDSFSAAEAAYFSSRGEDTSGLDAGTSQDGAGSPPASGQADAPTNGQTPASGQEKAGNEPPSDDADLEDGDQVVIVGKDGNPRDGQTNRFVPHAALHKRTLRIQALSSENATLKQNFARADERLKVLDEIISKADEPAPTQGKAPEAIDPEKDPIGALHAAMKQIADLNNKLAERDKQTSERDTARGIQQAYQNDAMAYVKERPEFREAYPYLVNQRHAELLAMNKTRYADKAVRDRVIAREEHMVVLEALESKSSPAQMMHELAIARGFKAAAPAPAADPNKLDPMAKIDALAKAQATAGASLSGAGGLSGDGDIRSQALKMGDAEFAAFTKTLSKQKLRELMGG